MVLGRCKGCEEGISARSKGVCETRYCEDVNEVLLNSGGKGKRPGRLKWGWEHSFKGISLTFFLLNEQLARECLFMASNIAKDQC